LHFDLHEINLSTVLVKNVFLIKLSKPITTLQLLIPTRAHTHAHISICLLDNSVTPSGTQGIIFRWGMSRLRTWPGSVKAAVN